MTTTPLLMHPRHAPSGAATDYRQGFANAMTHGYGKFPTGVVSTQYMTGFNDGIDQLYRTVPPETHSALSSVVTAVTSGVDDCQCVVTTQPLLSAQRRAVHILTNQWTMQKTIRIDTLGPKNEQMRRLRLIYDKRKQPNNVPPPPPSPI